jgi:soluble cytochrome b562
MKKKPTKVENAFAKLITLYDVCDELENSGEVKEAKKMRKTLNDVGKFLISLIKKEQCS